ncbi:hypothetical protein [Comamonas sp. wu1-DMT]|uniref:hypothetical protein n=1 Tax=Comamonas sp. wu1-DMT TaxID=3126390 RepID=UPI0032E38901
MPIDTSIYSQVGKGGDLSDLVNGYAMGQRARVQGRLADLQLSQAEREAAQGKAVNDAYSGSIGADGKVDYGKMYSQLASGGHGAAIPGLQKTQAEQEKAAMAAEAEKLKLGRTKFQYFAQALQPLLQLENIDDDSILRTLNGVVDQGYLAPEAAASYFKTLSHSQEIRRSEIRGALFQVLDAAKQFEEMTPKVQAQNLGGRTAMVDMNPVTNPGVVGREYQRTATPGEVEAARHNRASEGLTARGQNLADSRAREANANNLSRPFEVTGEDGKPMLVQQDKAGNIRPVQGYAPKGGAGTSKPLPTAALKMIQESKDAIGTASSINADLGAISQQITDGNLSFGPVSNLWNAARNAAGSSTEQSRNFASFKASLEKLRNDSLRLNKGVQTDGDAQRAWNELFQNINDTKLVQKRLGEIKRINDRAVQLRQLDIDGVLQNYGRSPMDTGAYIRQPSALSGSNSALPPRDAPANSSIDALLDKYK